MKNRNITLIYSRCLNCQREIKENFCEYCGQKTTTKKITAKNFIDSLFSKVLDLDKGFFYTFKNLIYNPKKITIPYVYGKRISVVNPIKYAFLTITFYIIIEKLFKFKSSSVETSSVENITTQFYNFGYFLGTYVQNNLKFFWLTHIFYISLLLRLFYSNFNYFEHLAINSFHVAQATMLGILLYILLKINIAFNPLVYLYLIFLITKTYHKKGDGIESTIAASSAVLISILLFMLSPSVLLLFD